jgi:hypothetical protein
LGNEAFPPLADGVPVAIALLRELLVGGRAGDGGTEEDAAARTIRVANGRGRKCLPARKAMPKSGEM